MVETSGAGDKQEKTTNRDRLLQRVGHISWHEGGSLSEEEAGRLLESCDDDDRRFLEQQKVPSEVIEKIMIRQTR